LNTHWQQKWRKCGFAVLEKVWLICSGQFGGRQSGKDNRKEVTNNKKHCPFNIKINEFSHNFSQARKLKVFRIEK